MFTYADLDAKRCSWSNFPSGIFNGRKGIRMGDLDATHRTAALAVVQSLMSAAGYTYATNAIAGDQALAAGGQANMGKDNYYLAFYGDPSADTAWTMQFGGHHLAIHVSIGGGTLSVTPYFQGLQPLSFELNGTKIAAMSVDASHMFGIFEAMDAAQLAKAKLPGSYNDLVMGPGADYEMASIGRCGVQRPDAGSAGPSEVGHFRLGRRHGARAIRPVRCAV